MLPQIAPSNNELNHHPHDLWIFMDAFRSSSGSTSLDYQSLFKASVQMTKCKSRPSGLLRYDQLHSCKLYFKLTFCYVIQHIFTSDAQPSYLKLGHHIVLLIWCQSSSYSIIINTDYSSMFIDIHIKHKGPSVTCFVDISC